MLLKGDADRISTLTEGRNPASALKVLQLNINLCCSNCYVHIRRAETPFTSFPAASMATTMC